MKSTDQIAYEIITDESIIFEDAEKEIENLIENTRMKFLAKLRTVDKKYNYNVFIENECVFDKNQQVDKNDFLIAYKNWCQKNNCKPHHPDIVGAVLQTSYKINLQKESKKDKLPAVFIGVGLKNG